MNNVKLWTGKPSRDLFTRRWQEGLNTLQLTKLGTQVLIFLGILTSAVLIALIFIMTQPRPPKTEKEEQATLVNIIVASQRPETLTVSQQGTVIPARQIELHAEVTGKVTSLSKKLIPGGRFQTGEELLRLDSRDYEYAVQQKKAQLEEARLLLKEEESRKKIAEQEWKLLGDEVVTSRAGRDLALRTAYLRKAKATFSAAENALLAAELNLSRTKITTPFNCFVQEESLDIGKLVTPQTSIAKLIGTDEFWVQVSVPVQELQWLIFPKEDGSGGSQARITQQIGKNSKNTFDGRLIKLIGDIKPDTRTARLLIEIKDPLKLLKRDNRNAPPLLLGAWVEVVLSGRQMQNLVVLPAAALREDSQAWIMNNQERLEIRKVEVLKYRADDSVLIKSGLKDGEKIVSSRIQAPLPGMKLRLNGQSPQGEE